jgi:uncharacterized protein involved in copper resistance
MDEGHYISPYFDLPAGKRGKFATERKEFPAKKSQMSRWALWLGRF